MIDLNVMAVVDLSSRLLPVILPRGGTIVTIAATAAFQPTPFFSHLWRDKGHCSELVTRAQRRPSRH